MGSKAKIGFGILLILMLTGGVLAFTPYGKDLWNRMTGGDEGGENVYVATVTSSFGVSGQGTSSLSIQQGYSVGNQSTNANVTKMDRNRYRERWRSKNGTPKLEQSQGKGDQGANVTVLMNFTLQTPSGKNITFSYNAVESKGIGKKEFMSAMGPNELNNTTGTFSLWIFIHVIVTPPGQDTPVVDRELHPVALTFTVPKGDQSE